MNRFDRRRAKSEQTRADRADARHARRVGEIAKKNAPLPRARTDGRPLYYDIGGSDTVECYHCNFGGLKSLYSFKQAFMNDPANSPAGDKGIYTICHHHLPDNAVIYNPATNTCRDKTGTNTWMEDNPEFDQAAKIAAKAGVATKSQLQ